jgi:hypothetical protein
VIADALAKSARGVAGKDADFLQRVVRRRAAAPGRHEAEDAEGAFAANGIPQRVVHLAARERAQRVLHDADALLHGQQRFDLMLGKNEDFGH